MIIPFTQFMRPHGRPKAVTIECEASQDTLVQDILDVGAKFEVELLNNDVVSMTCELEESESDDEDDIITLAHQLCANNEEVDEALRLLIDNAHTELRVMRRV